MTKLRTADLVKDQRYLMLGHETVTFKALTTQQSCPGRYHKVPLVVMADGREALISIRHLEQLPDTEEKTP